MRAHVLPDEALQRVAYPRVQGSLSSYLSAKGLDMQPWSFYIWQAVACPTHEVCLLSWQPVGH